MRSRIFIYDGGSDILRFSNDRMTVGDRGSLVAQRRSCDASRVFFYRRLEREERKKEKPRNCLSLFHLVCRDESRESENRRLLREFRLLRLFLFSATPTCFIQSMACLRLRSVHYRFTVEELLNRVTHSNLTIAE